MTKIRNTCLERRCVKCCLSTEMLSNSDIVRIRDLGLSEDCFVVAPIGAGVQNRTVRSDAVLCVYIPWCDQMRSV